MARIARSASSRSLPDLTATTSPAQAARKSAFESDRGHRPEACLAARQGARRQPLGPAQDAGPAEVRDAAVGEQLASQGAEVGDRERQEQERARREGEHGVARGGAPGLACPERQEGECQHREGLRGDRRREGERRGVAPSPGERLRRQQEEEERDGVELAVDAADEQAHGVGGVEPRREGRGAPGAGGRGEERDQQEVGREDGELDVHRKRAHPAAGEPLGRGLRRRPRRGIGVEPLRLVGVPRDVQEVGRHALVALDVRHDPVGGEDGDEAQREGEQNGAEEGAPHRSGSRGSRAKTTGTAQPREEVPCSRPTATRASRAASPRALPAASWA